MCKWRAPTKVRGLGNPPCHAHSERQAGVWAPLCCDGNGQQWRLADSILQVRVQPKSLLGRSRNPSGGRTPTY